MTPPPTTALTALNELVDRAERHGERELVHWVDGDGTTTYRTAYESAARWGALLAARGIERGDRVAVMLPNNEGFVGALFGAWFVGAIAVPLNTELRGESLRHPLRLYEPGAIVVSHELIDVVRAVADPAAALIEVDGRQMPRECFPDEPAEPAESSLQDACLIMSTSGTTGPSKGTVWDFGTLQKWVSSYREHLCYDDADRIFCCTPLSHANSLASGLLTALHARAAVVIADRFSVTRFWEQVTDSRATTANLLGSMIDLLLADHAEGSDRARARSRLRTMLVSSCSDRAYRAMQERWGLTPVSAYGLTDFGTITAATFGAEAPPGSVGRPVEGYEVRLVDDSDRDVSPGMPGELIVRTTRPWIAPPGYFRMPEQTLASRRDFWFRTGDLLRVEGGWWYFAGRKKDSMRRRGENVSAYEIEQVALAVPGIQEAGAYPIAADDSEDEIAIAVVRAPGSPSFDPREFLERLAQDLPYFAVPRYVRVMDALPQTPTHRVQKAILSDAGATADAWDAVREGFRVARNREV